MSTSFDCFLVLAYGFLVLMKKTKYESGVIYTTFLYMYIYIQPSIVGGFTSLVSFRKISGVNWISGDVSYRYDSPEHEKWVRK